MTEHIERNEMDERELLPKKVRYFDDILLKLGKEIREPYCLQFDDKGYDSQYNRFSESTDIPKIAERVTNDQLLSLFSSSDIVNHYTFVGRFYTWRNGGLTLRSEWPSIKQKLASLLSKHGDSLLAVLKACHKVYVEMGKQ